MFKPVDPHPDFSKIEEEILKFWQKNKIFQKSLENRQEKFVFYEGPPTANGRPGIHHVLARVFKDLIPRYKTMQGYKVKRRAGWDTHGLPVEIEVEKRLGLKNKKEIESFGVAKFNQECRKSVWQYKNEWEQLTRRIGFWIDLEHPYITYENSYIEKVWQILKEIWSKGLIYSGFKVVPYCPRCGTTLSTHEVAQGYQNIEEESIYVKFKIKGDKNKFFLVWTTTPWTLPANIALAVNPEIDYVEAEAGDETYILAKERLKLLDDPKIIKEFKGRELIGTSYEPLYEASDFVQIIPEKDYRVWEAKFVSANDGTGIVHIAPAFGEDDLELQKEKGFSLPITVDSEGKVLSKVGHRKFVKDADNDIKNDLSERNLIFKKENIRHDYPFCWRCESILIYFAKSSWFINMTKIKGSLISNNEKINWIPAYIKDGRFGNFLEEAKDWALSRERFWGTPLPIWSHQIGKVQSSKLKAQSDCTHTIFIGSIDELRKLATKPLPEDLDLHKPYIDEVKIKCEKCGSKMQRVPEVLDVWFDSGSMPFSSGEYPENYPADYISEAIDQTRGWFYTMLAIATLLEKGTPYKNVICLAHVLDEKGKKMSKSRGNVIDPWEVINKYGADSLRWYFLTVNNPGEPKRLSEKVVSQTQRNFISILWNVYSFFTTYAALDKWMPEKSKQSKNILDQWLMSRLSTLIKSVTENFEKYNLTSAAREIQDFTIELSTWYLRRSRKRRDGEFYTTLYEVLLNLSKIVAPFVPFVGEEIYQNLKNNKDEESVHLSKWPKAGEVDEELLKKMSDIRHLVELAHAQRAAEKIKVRQPLAKAIVKDDFESPELLEILKDEINVKEIKVDKAQKSPIEMDTKITPELKQEGIYREILRLIQDQRKISGFSAGQIINLFYQADKELEKIIKSYRDKIEKNTFVRLVDRSSNEAKEYNIDGQKIWLRLEK